MTSEHSIAHLETELPWKALDFVQTRLELGISLSNKIEDLIRDDRDVQTEGHIAEDMMDRTICGCCAGLRIGTNTSAVRVFIEPAPSQFTCACVTYNAWENPIVDDGIAFDRLKLRSRRGTYEHRRDPVP